MQLYIEVETEEQGEWERTYNSELLFDFTSQVEIYFKN